MGACLNDNDLTQAVRESAQRVRLQRVDHRELEQAHTTQSQFGVAELHPSQRLTKVKECRASSNDPDPVAVTVGGDDVQTVARRIVERRPAALSVSASLKRCQGPRQELGRDAMVHCAG